MALLVSWRWLAATIIVLIATSASVVSGGTSSDESQNSKYSYVDFMQNDYYGALGISKTASKAEIKRVYRKLSLELHPDKATGSEEEKEAKRERFTDVAEAYDVLRNDETRRQYDEVMESIPASFRPKYGEGVRHTIVEGLVIVLTILTIIKYVAQVVMYYETIRRVKNSHGYQMALKKALKKKLPPPELDIRGNGSSYPTWQQLFVVQFLRAPYQAPLYLWRQLGIWRAMIFGKKMSREDEKRWAMATYHMTEAEYEDAIAMRNRKIWRVVTKQRLPPKEQKQWALKNIRISEEEYDAMAAVHDAGRAAA